MTRALREAAGRLRPAGSFARALSRGVQRWLGGWVHDRARKALLPRPRGRRHVLIAVCDHFEPLHGGVERDVALARVNAWRDGYPRLARAFRDAAGRPPRHTFFFPGEQYDPAFVEPLAQLVDAGLGEVEVHLHHDGDTRATLTGKLRASLEDLGKHGVVPSRGAMPAWSFIHGNWALANGRPDGRWCGVDDELIVLRKLGCYADFTFPSAPDPCQPAIVNAIYYPHDERRRRAYASGDRVRVGARGRDTVLMIQGPLAISRRGGSRAALRIDAGGLDAGDPPSPARLTTWLEQWVHVAGRPEWTFVKLYTHGAPERNARVLLGEPMGRLHAALADLASDGRSSVYYVTAREMYNVVRAAMDGHTGSPAAYFDYEVPPAERARPEPT